MAFSPDQLEVLANVLGRAPMLKAEQLVVDAMFRALMADTQAVMQAQQAEAELRAKEAERAAAQPEAQPAAAEIPDAAPELPPIAESDLPLRGRPRAA